MDNNQKFKNDYEVIVCQNILSESSSENMNGVCNEILEGHSIWVTVTSTWITGSRVVVYTILDSSSMLSLR